MLLRFIVSLLASFCMIAPTVASQPESVWVYGVDFTLTRVYGADESVEEFRTAFEGINKLLLSEPEKYTISKFLDVPTRIDLAPMLARTAAADFGDLICYEDPVERTIDLGDALRTLNLKQEEGRGFVVFALSLDKANGCATLRAVEFDIATREVIRSADFQTKPRGFGLRNFWARTLYLMLRDHHME